MKSITVQASSSYDVIIGSGLYNQCGSMIQEVLPAAKKAAIISDTNVFPLYGKQVTSNLENMGYYVCSYCIDAGESSKNGENFLAILSFLAEHNFTRTDCILALGGGVVGDLAGFVASAYLRGIPYIQLPTSLLAMVDSSVGGKTAIDLPTGKNLAGAFYQPSLVLCDTDSLNTLPQEILIDGCAEVIKYAILFDGELFCTLQNDLLAFDRESVIERCVALKRDVVCADEFDHGMRQLLNLGHTIAHGVEKASEYKTPHGKAVAAGMAIAVRAAASYGFCTKETEGQIIALLNAFHLPTQTQYSAETLYHTALSDKKRSGDAVNLIIPIKIGNCIIHRLPVADVLPFIKAGL